MEWSQSRRRFQWFLLLFLVRISSYEIIILWSKVVIWAESTKSIVLASQRQNIFETNFIQNFVNIHLYWERLRLLWSFWVRRTSQEGRPSRRRLTSGLTKNRGNKKSMEMKNIKTKKDMRFGKILRQGQKQWPCQKRIIMTIGHR